MNATKERNLRVSFKLSREAAMKLREIALTRRELLCNLGVIAVQLGNESQICISPPLNLKETKESGEVTQRKSEEGFDSELTDSVEELSECESQNEKENLDKGVLEVDQELALATAASVQLEDKKTSENVTNTQQLNGNCTDKTPKIATVEQTKAIASTTEQLSVKSTSQLSTQTTILTTSQNTQSPIESTRHQTLSNTVQLPRQTPILAAVTPPNVNPTAQKTKSTRGKPRKSHATRVKQEIFETKRSTRVSKSSRNPAHSNRIAKDSLITQAINKFDDPSLSFAQQLINLSKQYRQENANSPMLSPTGDKYFSSTSPQIVGRDHILHCYNDKSEDFMGLNVSNSLLFDNYSSSSVKSAEELSKEQSEMSPVLDTNLETMSVSSPDSLFEEARLENVDDLSLSPTLTMSTNTSPSPSESSKSERNSPLKSRRSAKYQKLLKGQTGVVCELCVRPVQKSYSCYQMSGAPKEIMHLFDDGSRCVRVCRRCLPYKAPKGNDKNSPKKPKKMTELLK